MVARKYKARVPVPEPHLIREGSYHRCSTCGYPFAEDVHPSLNTAFAEHLTNSHQPGPTADSSHYAVRVLREAVEEK